MQLNKWPESVYCLWTIFIVQIPNSSTARILPIKLSEALKHFTLIKTLRLSNKLHDGAGLLSVIDGVSEMIHVIVITLD